MVEEKQSVINEEKAGAPNEKETQEQSNKPTGTESAKDKINKADERKTIEMDTQEVLSLLEADEQALKKAEDKIVNLKRRLKGGVGEDDDLRGQVEELREKLEQLTSYREDQADKDLLELQASRKKNAELTAILRSKMSISNNSLGSNQDKLRPEENPAKEYSAQELAIFRRMAARRNITLEEYLKSKK